MRSADESQRKIPADLTIGFIGCGQMGQAIVGGILDSGTLQAKNITVYERNPDTRNLAAAFGVILAQDGLEVVRKSSMVVIAVKPHIVAPVLKEISQVVTNSNLIVSIATGVSIASMEGLLPRNSRVVRVNPNTPALVQAGMAYAVPGTHATTQDIELVAEVFRSVGQCEIGEEKLLDVVGAVSGSGPAYIYAAIEALSDGGVKMGLPRALAQKLAAQMTLGAAKMVLETGKHPGQLKDSVCSPGGTTIAAMHKLEKGGMRGTLIDAVEAATLRARDLVSKDSS